jgi:thiamine-monophosphate kinase
VLTVTLNSETEFIQSVLRPLTGGRPCTFGLGDDAAVLTIPDGHDLVVTTDAVASGVHFFAEDSARDIGWKALAVNASDLIAKGAKPLAYQMALAFDGTPTETWVKDFADGLRAAQTAFGLYLSGGDTDNRKGPLTITITAFGTVPKGRMVRRDTASVGHKIFVSGTIGDSTLGLLVRHNPERAPRWGLTRDQQNHLLSRYLRPLPAVDLRAAILEHASAAMDISDGLAQDLGKLAAASGVGAVIEANRVPVSEAAQRALAQNADLMTRIVSGGDDYEMLVAVAPEKAHAFEAAAIAVGVAVHQIGTLTADRDVKFLTPNGTEIVLNHGGWDHFRTDKSSSTDKDPA